MHESPFAEAYRPHSYPLAAPVARRRPALRRPRLFGRGRLSALGVVLPVESRTVAGCPGLPELARGAMLYKMNAGMGDVVFAPLYQVLEV